MASRLSVPGLLLLLVLLLQTAVAGQNQQPTFRGETQIVEVDVIVRDGQGRFVEGLTRDDFEIEEDGRPQRVETAFLVGGPMTPTRAPDAAAPPAGIAAGARARRLFIFVFDDQHIAPGAFKQLQSAAESFLRDQFQDADIGGIVAGGRMLDDRLTSRREELIESLRRVKPSGERSARIFDLNDYPRFISEIEAVRVHAGDTELLEQVVRRANRDQPPGPGMWDPSGAIQTKAAKITSELRAAALQTLNMLETLAQGLGRLPGRKTVVFLTSGFYIDETWARLPEIVGRAARARVTFYTIDARGLDRTAAGRDIRDAQFSETEARFLAAFDTWEDAPNSVAVDSGGFVVRNTNDYRAAFADIAADTSTYYVLGYAPTLAPDGTFRKITVRVRRPGVTVRARKGYVADARQFTAARSPAAGAAAAGAAAPAPGGAVVDVGRAPLIRARLEQARTEAPVLAAAVDALLAAAPREALAALSPGATPAPPVADLIAGLAHFALRDDPAATAALKRGVTALPTDPLPSFVLGWVHATAGRDRDAAGAYRNATVIAPSFVPAHLALADSYLRMSQIDLARQALRAGIAANPASAELQARLQALEKRSPAPMPFAGNPAADLETANTGLAPRARPSPVERLLQLSPAAASDGSTRAAEGWAAYTRGDVESAARLLDQATSEPGAKPWVHYALGFARLAEGKAAAAVRAWEHVRQAAPDFEPVYFDLTDVYLQVGDDAAALRVLQAAQQRWQSDAEVWNAHGVVQVRRGVLQEAVESFSRAIAIAPDDPAAHFNLGRAHQMRYLHSRRYNAAMGRWLADERERNSAIASFRQCVALGGPYVAAAREALSALEWR